MQGVNGCDTRLVLIASELPSCPHQDSVARPTTIFVETHAQSSSPVESLFIRPRSICPWLTVHQKLPGFPMYVFCVRFISLEAEV